MGKRVPKEFENKVGICKYCSGLIFKDSDAQDMGQDESVLVLWLLNLASRYWDLWLQKEQLVFNIEKMVETDIPIMHMLLLGLEGPFGSLHSLNKDSNYVYKLLPQQNKARLSNNGKVHEPLSA
jgi:hypothetical protein